MRRTNLLVVFTSLVFATAVAGGVGSLPAPALAEDESDGWSELELI